MDLILTVIVGWLGFIIGKFFSEEAMQTLQEKQKGSVHHLVDKLKESKSILEQSEKMLSSIKDQREP